MARCTKQNYVVPYDQQRQNDNENRKPVLGVYIRTDKLRIPNHVKGDRLKMKD